MSTTETTITRYEFQVFNERDHTVACGDAATREEAEREGRHYLAQYQQDGPCTLELRKVDVLSVSALPPFSVAEPLVAEAGPTPAADRATTTTNHPPLSPAAQAVLDAYLRELPPDYEPGGIAAALRAAANEIDWESGDPKFLVLAIAVELKDINQSD